MSEERYKIELSMVANEQGDTEGEEPMVQLNVRWNRATYTQLVQTEDNVLKGVLGETVKWGKANTKFKGLRDH